MYCRRYWNYWRTNKVRRKSISFRSLPNCFSMNIFRQLFCDDWLHGCKLLILQINVSTCRSTYLSRLLINFSGYLVPETLPAGMIFSMLCRSSAVRLTFSDAMFSSRFLIRLVPGIVMMSSPVQAPRQSLIATAYNLLHQPVI